MTLENFDTILAFAAIMLLLSLLITTLVQFTLAALGLRRKNLLWGVRRVLERSPRLKSHADVVARAALYHPAVSHSGQSADVIGSVELLSIVEDLVEDPEALEESTRNALRSALATHGITDEAIDQARLIKERLREQFPDEADRLEETIEETLSDARQSASELASGMNRWFETVMNCVSARFRLQARFVTVGLAVVFAFVLQIDAIELIRDLSTDSEVRAAVIQGMGVTMQRAETVLETGSIATAALESIRAQLPPSAAAIVIPSAIATQSKGELWLRQLLAEAPDIETIVASYDAEFDRITRQELDRLGIATIELKDQLAKSRLDLIPTTFPSWEQYRGDLSWGHVLGMLITAFLLSLGAPFWFSVLGSMAALRPMLAGKADPSK